MVHRPNSSALTCPFRSRSPPFPPQCQTCLKTLERHVRNDAGKNFFVVIILYVAYAWWQKNRVMAMKTCFSFRCKVFGSLPRTQGNILLSSFPPFPYFYPVWPPWYHREGRKEKREKMGSRPRKKSGGGEAKTIVCVCSRDICGQKGRTKMGAEWLDEKRRRKGSNVGRN